MPIFFWMRARTMSNDLSRFWRAMILSWLTLSACSFGSPKASGIADGSAADDAGSDSAMMDGRFPDAMPDSLPPCPAGQGRTDQGACEMIPEVICSLETIAGQNYDVYTFSGYLTAGLDGAVPIGAVPLKLQYGSETDTTAVQATVECDTISERYQIPNPSGCGKPEMVLTGIAEPVDPQNPDQAKIVVIKVPTQQVNYVTFAIIYDQPAAAMPVRYFDLRSDDGDPVGLKVSGSGTNYACRIIQMGGRWVIKFWN